jgi:hypothetical protein
VLRLVDVADDVTYQQQASSIFDLMRGSGGDDEVDAAAVASWMAGAKAGGCDEFLLPASDAAGAGVWGWAEE